MIIGIVGSEAAKFTPTTEAKARKIIQEMLTRPGVTGYSSGHCHLGGIDIWTEEIGDDLNLEAYVFPPRFQGWEAYKERNLKIAKVSDEVICITVKELPESFTGMKFDFCYHCKTKGHIKSGGCWTVKKAIEMGKIGEVHVVSND